MPKAISVPLEKEFSLDKFDPSGETKVTFRQATQAQHAAMSEMFSEVSRVMRGSGTGQEVEVRTRISQAEVWRRAVWLTMTQCNILAADGKSPLFKFRMSPNGQSWLDMTEEAFNQLAWGLLPMEAAEELYNKCIEVNPQWSEAGK